MALRKICSPTQLSRVRAGTSEIHQPPRPWVGSAAPRLPWDSHLRTAGTVSLVHRALHPRFLTLLRSVVIAPTSSGEYAVSLGSTPFLTCLREGPRLPKMQLYLQLVNPDFTPACKNRTVPETKGNGFIKQG